MVDGANDNSSNNKNGDTKEIHDPVQDSVLGVISTDVGTYYIRNSECKIDYSRDTDEKDYKDALIEQQLYKNLREFANPKKQRF